MTERPLLGITMGDAAGIGPELILKAFAAPRLYEQCRPLVIGSGDVMNFYRAKLDIGPTFRVIADPTDTQSEPGTLDLLDIGGIDADKLQIGQVDAVCGRGAVVYTQEAGRLALDGTIDAIVSAPLNKEAMRAAGYEFEGQTQILGEMCNAERYGMILLLGQVRVMLLTTHVSLRKACDAVTSDRVLKMIELAHEALPKLGIDDPTIAVAGLNPHSGEGGLFGTEEIEGSIPAIEAARDRGINAVGPVPADVVFVKARDGAYDLVLAMYHDQATMAAKLMGFGEVVTLLAGLPIIRTSVGHGTAFDIAGRGIADERNFCEAILAAADLARRRKEGSHEQAVEE